MRLPATKESSMLIFIAPYLGGCHASSRGSFRQKTMSFRAFHIAQSVAAISSKEGEISSKGRKKRFSLEGMAFWQSLQRKILIFGGGARTCHIQCQSFQEGL